MSETQTDPPMPSGAPPPAGDSPESAEATREAVLERELDQLRQAMEAQAARLDEVLRAYSRLQQDKDDFRRRAERERERVLEVERGNVALTLLEAVDQLDLSLAAVPSDGPAASKDCQALAGGVQLIRDGLLRRIEQNGIARFTAVGAAFDPNLHEAVELVPVAEEAFDGQVITELRAGYRQGDRVLRPARVTVGKLAVSHPAPGKN